MPRSQDRGPTTGGSTVPHQVRDEPGVERQEARTRHGADAQQEGCEEGVHRRSDALSARADQDRCCENSSTRSSALRIPQCGPIGRTRGRAYVGHRLLRVVEMRGRCRRSLR